MKSLKTGLLVLCNNVHVPLDRPAFGPPCLWATLPLGHSVPYLWTTFIDIDSSNLYQLLTFCKLSSWILSNSYLPQDWSETGVVLVDPKNRHQLPASLQLSSGSVKLPRRPKSKQFCKFDQTSNLQGIILRNTIQFAQFADTGSFRSYLGR
jgi:hypothetical protein